MAEQPYMRMNDNDEWVVSKFALSPKLGGGWVTLDWSDSELGLAWSNQHGTAKAFPDQATAADAFEAVYGTRPADYYQDPDCACDGKCKHCAQMGCEACCDGYAGDHGCKDGA